MTSGQSTPAPLPVPILWLIADAATTPETRVLGVLEALRPLFLRHDGRVGLIERDHTGTPDALRFARIEKLRAFCLSAHVPFWVNGRVDLAIAADADGVQLTSFGLAPDVVARHFPTLPFAVSCHVAAEIANAHAAGARFALLSPFDAPTSKPATRPALGTSSFATLAQDAALPVIALGGITPTTAKAAFEAGASGVATLGAVFAADDPAAFVEACLATATPATLSGATGSSGAS